MNPETDVTYRTRGTENLYFISDVPHLLKTARNCLSNSRVVNLHVACAMTVYFYYGTILLTHFMKIKNVDFIYFQNYA